jgi:hypothetical protein
MVIKNVDLLCFTHPFCMFTYIVLRVQNFSLYHHFNFILPFTRAPYDTPIINAECVYCVLYNIQISQITIYVDGNSLLIMYGSQQSEKKNLC